MGAGGSVHDDGFDQKLEEIWADEASRAKLKQRVQEARKFVAKKSREQSVGKIEHPLPDGKQDELWSKLDYNGNGFSSLAELDKLIVENYPEYDNKPAIMRAYDAIDRNNNGFISKAEFKDFFYYLDYFTKLWEKFEDIDEDRTRTISLEELQEYSGTIFGKKLSDQAAATLFATMDRNNGGKVLFYEFVAHFANIEKNITVDKLPFE